MKRGEQSPLSTFISEYLYLQASGPVCILPVSYEEGVLTGDKHASTIVSCSVLPNRQKRYHGYA